MPPGMRVLRIGKDLIADDNADLPKTSNHHTEVFLSLEHSWRHEMGQPLKLPCEQCGSEATVDMKSHTDAAGKRIEWPNATVKADGIYFSVNCPNCGTREQLMAERSDTM